MKRKKTAAPRPARKLVKKSGTGRQKLASRKQQPAAAAPTVEAEAQVGVQATNANALLLQEQRKLKSKRPPRSKKVADSGAVQTDAVVGANGAPKAEAPALLAHPAVPSKHSPKRVCGNEACGRSLLCINPVYTIYRRKGEYCSRVCRATVTNEQLPAKFSTDFPAEPVAGSQWRQRVASMPKSMQKAAAAMVPDRSKTVKGNVVPPKAQAVVGAKQPRAAHTTVDETQKIQKVKDPGYRGRRGTLHSQLREGKLISEYLKDVQKAGYSHAEGLGHLKWAMREGLVEL